MKAIAAALALALCCCAPAGAQPADSFARMVVLVPKPGQAADFEKGYERHLQWHRGARDPWTWYGWTFVLGARVNQFMDGTFGHPAADFDAAVRPAADAADNALNVNPYADFASHAVYQRVDAISTGEPLPDASPFLALTTYHVRPGQAVAFEVEMARQHDKSARRTWYRLQIGGQVPVYLLMRALPSFGAAATIGTPSAPASIVDKVESELLRYRPNLSYQP